MYDDQHIGMALNANPVGNMGGYSYLYLVCMKYQRTEYGKKVRKQ